LFKKFNFKRAPKSKKNRKGQKKVDFSKKEVNSFHADLLDQNKYFEKKERQSDVGVDYSGQH